MIPYRDDNPTQTWPFITWLLVAANIAVYVWMVTGGNYQADVCYWGAMAGRLTGSAGSTAAAALPCPPAHAATHITIFSHMFIHGGLLHLAGNMVYLLIFGNNIEDTVGHFNFLLFYLLCGLGALFIQVLSAPGAMVPMVGASGAIAGVLGAYLILFPFARISVLVPVFIFLTTVRVPAVFMLLLWFGIQVGAGILGAGEQGGGVAWFAHVGGFVAGVVLILVFPKRRKKRR